MERPSRLSVLPRELIDEMLYLQNWRDIRESLKLPRYAKYRNPDDPIWKRLYHARLSRYSLPEDSPSNYQQQFFWGSALADNPNTNIDYLARLGYDVALRKRDLSESDHYDIRVAFVDAAGKGYLPIVRYIWKNDSGVGHYIANAVANAVENGHRDVVEYLHSQNQNVWFDDTLPMHESLPVEATRVSADTMFRTAVSGGDFALAEFIIQESPLSSPKVITDLLDVLAWDYDRPAEKADYLLGMLPADYDVTELINDAYNAHNTGLIAYLTSRR